MNNLILLLIAAVVVLIAAVLVLAIELRDYRADRDIFETTRKQLTHETKNNAELTRKLNASTACIKTLEKEISDSEGWMKAESEKRSLMQSQHESQKKVAFNRGQIDGYEAGYRDGVWHSHTQERDTDGVFIPKTPMYREIMVDVAKHKRKLRDQARRRKKKC